MLSLFLCLSLGLSQINAQNLNQVGWFLKGSQSCPHMNATNFPYGSYTHILVTDAGISVLANGTAVCDQGDTVLQQFVTNAAIHGVRVMVREGVSNVMVNQIIINGSDPTVQAFRANYLSSIKQALDTCNVAGGIEFDYEFDTGNLPFLGYVSPADSTAYTQFLADVKTAIGQTRQVGANLGVLGPGVLSDKISYPLEILPWVNVSMVNAGKIDYINTMSYHLIDNTLPWLHNVPVIQPWVNDAYVYQTLWGFSPSKVNLGIGYYSYNQSYGSLNWCQLAEMCPSQSPSSSYCQGFRYISKMQNYLLGKYAHDNGFGTMIFAANNDYVNTPQNNNSLVNWLNRGFSGQSL
jgi:hypothetical protein